MIDQERIEEVRKEIAKVIVRIIKADRTGKQTEVDAVDQILNVKDKDGKPMLAILSDDQRPPMEATKDNANIAIVRGEYRSEGFRRVIIVGDNS